MNSHSLDTSRRSGSSGAAYDSGSGGSQPIMNKIIALAALLAAGAAHGQTYDVAVEGSTFGFGGSFTFNASTDTFSNINLGEFDSSLGLGGGDSFTFYNCFIGPNCQAPAAISFTTNVPLGTAGPIELTSFMYEFGNSLEFCASSPGVGSEAQEQQVCSVESITAVPNVNSAPEMGTSTAAAALTLLAGFGLALQGKTARGGKGPA
jgi:uncharacterized protein YfiM (DUF2279 family)